MSTVIRILAVIVVLAAPLAAEAQQIGKVYRVGYLSAASRETSEHVYQALAGAHGAWLDLGPEPHCRAPLGRWAE